MAALAGGVGLLERAISYALGSVAAVTPPLLSGPTPCSQWDLRTLLQHLNDSLAALYKGIDTRCIGADTAVAAVDRVPAADLVATIRDRAGRLLGAWTYA